MEEEFFDGIFSLFDWDGEEAKTDGGMRLSKRFGVIMTSLMHGPASSLDEEVGRDFFARVPRVTRARV